MALASLSQQRQLSRQEGGSKAGVEAEVVISEEEGQGITGGAYLWLRQQMFSGDGIFSCPTPGLVSLNFQCVCEMHVVGWSLDGGFGSHSLMLEG